MKITKKMLREEAEFISEMEANESREIPKIVNGRGWRKVGNVSIDGMFQDAYDQYPLVVRAAQQ